MVNPVDVNPETASKKEFKNVKLKEGVLGNVAPTILDIFGVKKPKEMNLDSLIIK